MKTSDEAATLLQAVHRIADVVQRHADEAERNRRLSLPVVSALADAGLFRMGLPADLGGLEVSPLTFYRAIEAVAALDGSAGWCAFIGASSAFGGAFLSNEAAEEIYGRDSRVITGGSVAPVGKALVRDGGYVVSGRWPYASGCQHSSWLFAACQVIDGDRVRLTPAGAPEVRLACVPAGSVTILEDTWDVSGLAGTGSHDFTIDGVYVPGGYTLPLGPGMLRGKHYQGALYHSPLVGLLRLPTSAVALGIAQRAVQACMQLVKSKPAVIGTGVLRDQPLIQARMADAVALVNSGREWLHAVLERTWEVTARGPVSPRQRAELLLAALNATRRATEAVQSVYTIAGGSANYRRSSLQRSLRDIQAVTQHVGMAPQQYEEAGRMLLGLDSLQPLLRL
jgi:alkylation response protein AidB-like acyl-CoA dehydrogenase